MRVLITGATGLIGQRLVKYLLAQGHNVHYLTTRKSAIKEAANFKGFYWNIKENSLDTTCFNGVDKIVHLAGASVSKRWTPSWKKQILESRINTTKLLYNHLKSEKHQVNQFITASGISIYKDSLTACYTEESGEVQDDFLGNVVKDWEDEAEKFEELGIAVSKIRTGIVLAKEGALAKMAGPIRLGLGAVFGSGRQYQSWIHINDLVRIYSFVMSRELRGVFNATAPNPVTSKELTKTIAKQLSRPILLPNIPKLVMRLVLGEMHQLLFLSQNVDSEKIVKKGFKFNYPSVKEALEDLLL